MANPIPIRHREIMLKQSILDKAKITLKQEFIGIDRIIDEVIDAISSWYLFPDLQEKPVIINLWGLTGVGKSSLVSCIAHLIEFDKQYYHFDLGESDTIESTIKRQVEKIYENVNGFPVLLAFDEFQHARTLNETGMEMNKSTSRIIWQLLNSGRFQISRYSYFIEDLYDLIQKLRYLLKNGVGVEQGKVISKVEYFIEQMEPNQTYEKSEKRESVLDTTNVLFIPESYYDNLWSLSKELFSTQFELNEKLTTLNGHETIRFLLDIFTFSNSPKSVDCSKGLIFVLGNLDEAYKMSQDFNPDMDAYEFHEQSLKINVPIIKKALKLRFRNEQIARLGNIHLIYPAFSRNSYQKIIKLELCKITDKVNRHYNINLQFDQSVHDIIYNEGVYPTQGTRPIFTTIHQIINTKLGRIISEMILNNLSVTGIVLRSIDSRIIADYYTNDTAVHSLSIEQHLNLENLRRDKRNDVQAITAVHEAGHAIISIILLHTVPEAIFSNTAEADTRGFVFTKFKWDYISKKELLNRLALFLAGRAAEVIIFGDENVTTGAEEDIERATGFITAMLKQCGMGKLPVAYHAKQPNTRNFVYDTVGVLCNEAEAWISKALSLAEKILKEQEVLLLKMADYLSDHRQLNKQQITQLLENYGCNFDFNSLIENGDLLFYRNHLKNKVATLEQTSKKRLPINSREFSLNTKSSQ